MWGSTGDAAGTARSPVWSPPSWLGEIWDIREKAGMAPQRQAGRGTC